MKNLKKLMFTFLFVVVSVFTMGKVKALSGDQIEKQYIDSTATVVSGADKASVSVISESALTAEMKTNLNHAADLFYGDGFGTSTKGYVKMIPMKVNVTGNIGTGNVELYIKVPDEMYTARGNDSVMHLRFARLNNDATSGYVFDPVMGVPGSGSKYEMAYDANNAMIFTRGTLNGTTFTQNDNGDNYIIVKTNFKAYTLDPNAAAQGSELTYVLAICYSQEPVTTTTTTSVPETTTVPNPETLDGRSTMYIVLGVIGLIGVIGLGSKFAKSSK